MLKKTISILHFAGPPIVGGVESTIAYHADHLTRLGYQVRIIAGRGERIKADIDYVEIPELDSRHPAVMKIGKQLAKGQVTQEFYSLRALIQDKLMKVIHSSHATIAHNIHTLHKNLPFTSAYHRLCVHGQKSIAWCHDFSWQDELYTPDLHDGYPWNLLKTTWPHTRYVVVSEHRRMRLAQLLDLPQEEIVVITPGVDHIAFLNIAPESVEVITRLNLLAAQPLMILPARITRRKNIEFGVKITGALREYRPACLLIVTGPPGPHNPQNTAYLNSLINLREELELTNHVLFLYESAFGPEPLHLTDRMMADLFQISDLLLFPSRKEGFGIPILEAGLTRIPVFAADIPPVHESAGQFAHLFSLSASPTSVAKLIDDHLAADYAYQLRKRVLSHFTWESIIKNKIVPLIEEL